MHCKGLQSCIANLILQTWFKQYLNITVDKSLYSIKTDASRAKI